jgi:hypothetical protein
VYRGKMVIVHKSTGTSAMLITSFATMCDRKAGRLILCYVNRIYAPVRTCSPRSSLKLLQPREADTRPRSQRNVTELSTSFWNSQSNTEALVTDHLHLTSGSTMSGRQDLKRGAGMSSDAMSEYDSLMPQRRGRGWVDKKRKTLRIKGSQTEKDVIFHDNHHDSITSATIPQPRKNDGGREMSIEVVETGSEDDSQPVVSSRRRKTSRQAGDGHSQASRQERDDLEAEMADLETESLSQLVFDKPLSNFKSASLARLKANRLRKSQGLPSLKPNKLSSQDDEQGHVTKTESTTASDMFDTDTDDGDFVEEDTETTVSAMDEDNWLNNLRTSSMELKDLWPHELKWMVKRSLGLYVEEDERFRHAFERLDKEPSGLVSSKHNSSSWNSSFTTALTRPGMVSAPTTSEVETCDACDQTRHSAIFEVRFYGKLYCRET